MAGGEVPAKCRAATVEAREDTDFDIEDLGGLEDPEKVAKEQAREVEPSLKGNVLTVPVRAHDFRVIALD